MSLLLFPTRTGTGARRPSPSFEGTWASRAGGGRLGCLLEPLTIATQGSSLAPACKLPDDSALPLLFNRQ